MTEEQVRTGMAILNKIKELENYYKEFDKFKEYVRNRFAKYMCDRLDEVSE